MSIFTKNTDTQNNDLSTVLSLCDYYLLTDSMRRHVHMRLFLLYVLYLCICLIYWLLLSVYTITLIENEMENGSKKNNPSKGHKKQPKTTNGSITQRKNPETGGGPLLAPFTHKCTSAMEIDVTLNQIIQHKRGYCLWTCAKMRRI